MIVSGVREFMSIRVFGSVSIIAYPLLTANNQSVRHNLLVHRTLPFDEETTTCEFFTQHPPILCVGRWEMVLVDVALNTTIMRVDPTFAMPQSVPLKDGATIVLGVNLLFGHFCGTSWSSRSRHLRTTWPARWTCCARQPSKSPLLVAFAIAIMIFWHLERIRDALH
jgi:hypothetical protein